ncbi:MAG: hypothetical protein QOH65_2157 [Methylobacteriaceae bacterium]|jgi:hypothetical protein|nr:hypothetical protein [Methylobacteriaceae bacterium]
MPYLQPHFDPDIFVSYSHGDPRGTGGSSLKAWTCALIRALEDQILSLDPEFDGLDIWIDEKIDPTAHLTEGLRAKVGASGVLIIIMSKRYLASSWCRDELDWFRSQIVERSGDLGRVFIIRAQPTDAKDWPDFLRDERGHEMPGFCFHDRNDGFPLGWPELKQQNEDVVKELGRLQTALTRRLRELRDRAEKRTKAEEVARALLLPRIGPRRIYLHSGSDAEPERVNISHALEQDGIVPLTAHINGGGGLAGWQRDSKARMEAAKRCEALALLRADDDDRFVGDLIDIGVDECDRIANARGAPFPCAILDKTGTNLPIDVSPFRIERFDVTQENWRGRFRDWLDRPHVQ